MSAGSSGEKVAERKLRMGLIGGGEGAFIGAVHRMAAELDGEITLVCGAFSSDPARSRRSGERLYRLPAARCYPDYRSMFEAEAQLDASERMDFVTVATPNHVHFDAARLAIESGFDVVCDKPLTHRLADALALSDRLAKSDRLFCLTHNYTGYPMVREARSLVASGRLGRIRRVSCEYLQGWLAGAEERSGNRQAEWRTDPQRAGAAGCFGDIGSHAQNLLEFVTGERIEAVAADIRTWVPGRALDDDGDVLLRLSGGARGVLSASQIAVGEENALTLRIYGEQGGLEWRQMSPNTLHLKWPDRSLTLQRTGGPGASVAAGEATRLPAGHPEGYLEAFAVLYRNFARALRARNDGARVDLDFPGVAEGVRGMAFIDTVVKSSREGGRWLDLPA
ncbi:MAG: Gfo/Idh/MocA family protein [Pseudomonadales bacterium]